MLSDAPLALLRMRVWCAKTHLASIRFIMVTAVPPRNGSAPTTA